MNNYIIKPISKSINIYSGYSPKYSQQREIQALLLLSQEQSIHFPKLIEVKKNKYIKITNQGIDLKKLKKTNKIINVYNLDKQLATIYAILSKTGIAHIDLNDNGKNICVSNNGIISLIDFDIVHFVNTDNNSSLTPLMKNRIQRFTYCNTFLLFYNKMIKIISLCRNIRVIQEEPKYQENPKYQEEKEHAVHLRSSIHQSIQQVLHRNNLV